MTSNPHDRVRRLLDDPGTILMDGGMGTTLEDRGTHCRSALWSSYALLTATGLALNDEIHAEFADAGARILIANTHNASLAACRAYLEGDGPGVDLAPDLVRRGPEALLESINGRAVASARQPVGAWGRPVVAAGVGSAEGPYATTSRLRPSEVAARLLPQVRVLRDLSADLILFETLTTASEIEGVAELARADGFPPFGAGLTCGPDGRTLAGVSMEEAWDRLRHASPTAVFIQCTRFDHVASALAALQQVMGARAECGVYANDGRVWEGRVWSGDRVTPEEYAAAALQWADAGVRIIGGCCGTSPEHVRELRRRLG